VWTPDELFGVGDFGDWIDWRDADHLFTDTAGTINVAAAGDLIARANGRRGNVVLSQSTSGNRGKWALADGISSELVSSVVMDGTFASRTYPALLTVVHVSRKANAAGGGDTSDIRVRGADTFGTRAGHSGNNSQGYVFNSRNGATATGGTDSVGYSLHAVIQRSASASFRVIRGSSVIHSGTPTNGTATDFNVLRLDQRRNGDRFAYATVSLFIERELTNDELILLAAYAGA
jgi:hypothetical protein